MTRIETSRAPRATLSLPTRRRSLSPAMSERIEEVEPWIAATDVKEAVELAMSRQCAMFGVWAANCATSRPSSPRGSQAGIDVELPKTAVAALLIVMHLLRARRKTRMTRLGARRAEDRCPATATTRL